jgi:hypothetical protein
MGENNMFLDSIGEAGQDGKMSANPTSFCGIYEKEYLRPGKAYTDYTEKSRFHGFLKYIIRRFRLFSVFRCTRK